MQENPDKRGLAEGVVEKMEMAAGITRLICLMQIIERKVRDEVEHLREDGVHAFAVEAAEDFAEHIKSERMEMSKRFIETMNKE